MSNPALPEDYDEKAATERRRLREKLDMARNSCKMTTKSLVDADLWAEKPMGDRIVALYRKAQGLQREIEALLQEVQGEE